jgi:hypothetical protein
MQEYAYYTLGTLAVCTVLFCAYNIYKRDWLSLCLNPYLLVIFFYAYVFHQRTIIPNMGKFVDLSLAAAFVLISISFWLVYQFTPSAFITKRFLPLFQIKYFDTDITKRSTYYILFISAIALCFLSLAYRYGITKDWNTWLFASRYYMGHHPAQSFPYRQINILLQLFNHTLNIGLAILFIVPFIKQTSINKICYQSISCLLAFFWTFICFGAGSRHYALFVPSFILFFTFLLCIKRVQLAKRYFVVFFIYCLVVLLSLLLMPFIRLKGVPAINSLVQENKNTVMQRVSEEAFIATVDQSQIDNTIQLYNENTTEKKLIKENIQPNEKIHLEPRPQLNILFFRTFRPRSYPDFITECLMYYGTYKPHYGTNEWIHRQLLYIVPRAVQKSIGIDKHKQPPIHIQAPIDIQSRKKDSKFSFPMGLMAEGYIFWGYIGAIFLPLFGGIYFGFVAKIIVTILKSNLWNKLDILLLLGNGYILYILCGAMIISQILSTFVATWGILLFTIVFANLFCYFVCFKKQSN